MATPTIQIEGTIRISLGSQGHLKTRNLIDNLQYSISRLTNLNTVHEKGKFPSQPHRIPRVSMKWRLGRRIFTDHQPGRYDEETHASTIPTSFAWKKGINNASEILEVLRQVKVNIPLLDMIKQVPTYAKFLKDLCTIKRGLNVRKKAFLTEQVSSIIHRDMCGESFVGLGANVNFLPYCLQAIGTWRVKANINHSISSEIDPSTSSICAKQFHPEEENDQKRVTEPSNCLLLASLKMREEILHLFNGRRHKKLGGAPKAYSKVITHAEPYCYFFISYHYSGGLST
ncbi:hypothetical protein AAG906_028136 [Vitis piasezkii]